MRHILVLILLTVLGSGWAAAVVEDGPVRVEQRVPHGWRGSVGPLPLLVLQGDARTRAEAHGRLAAREIMAIMNGYVLPLAQRAGYPRLLRLVEGLAWDAGWRAEAAAMLRGIETALPDPADRQLAGLGRVLAAQDLLLGNALPDWAGLACSSLSVWGEASVDGRLRSARNLDFPASAEMLTAQMLICLQPEDPEQRAILGVGWAGCLGVVTALNSDGVFVAIHDVPAPPPAALAGVSPRSLALREALAAADGPAAFAAALQGRRSAIGNNLHLSHASGAAIIEWGPLTAQQARLRLAEGEDWLACTNHHLLDAGSTGSADSLARYRSLAENARGPRSIADLQQALHAVARPSTLHSVIVDPAAAWMAVALARSPNQPATEEPWTGVAWSAINAAGGN